MTDDETRRVDMPSGEPAPETIETPAAAAPPTPASQPFPPIAAAPAAPSYAPPPAAVPPGAVPPAPAPPAAAPAPATPPPAGSVVTPAYAATATTEPVRGPGSSRARWFFGLGVAGLAIAIGVAAFLILGARPVPEALRYIPGGAGAVAEVRADLPGDQLQKLGNFLSNFPGFADQSTLPDKLDEGLSQVLGSASGGTVDYRTDVKPWLNGPLFIGIPAPAAGTSEGESFPLISATTNGAVDCATALGGGSVTRETYRNLEILTAADAAEPGLSCVIDQRQALLGQPAAVKAALDAKADGSGMDKDARYTTARAALASDQLLTVFVDGDAIGDAFPMPSFGDLPLPSGLPFPGLGGLPDLRGALPDWTIVGVRAEDDALVVESFAAPVPAASSAASLLPLPASHPSVLASMLPADTLLLVEDQGTGVSLQNLLATLREDPTLGAPLGMLDGMGGAGELVGWIQDAGIAVVGSVDAPTGGVLLVATDETAARNRVATLTNLLSFAGLGGGIEVREATIAGVTVTTIVISDLSALVPPGTIPGDVEVPSDGPIEFSIAAKGRVILLGVGEEFMTSVLGVQPGQTLADQASYDKAFERSLTNSRTSLYVDVRNVIDLAEGMIPAEELAQWESDIKPYVEPVQAVAATTFSDASGSRSRLIITVSPAE
jgi:hypothetical protein